MILRTSPTVKKQRYTKRDCQAFLYLLPWLIGILALQLYPFLSSLVYSFHDYTVGGKMDFVGIDNYVKLFTKDRDFWNSLKVTLLFGVYTVPGKLILALAVALFLNRNIKSNQNIFWKGLITETVKGCIWSSAASWFMTSTP